MDKIIIDTDIGVDDAIAIAYAVKHFDIIGITTVYGNVDIEQAVKNARFFTQLLGINIPVYRGFSRPLAIQPSPVNNKVHGADGLGGVFNNNCSGEAEDAISFIIDTVMSHPHDVTLVAIGPLTNIAVALNREPRIAGNVKNLVIMGGAFGTHGHQGNVTPLSEFNIWKDPHAADQILAGTIPVTVIPLDVTHEVIISGDEIRQTGNQPIIDMTRGYLAYSLREEGFEGMALHDALTIAYLSQPQDFQTICSPLRVITEGISIGQTLRKVTHMASRANPFLHVPEKTICLEVDSEKVKRHLLQSLANDRVSFVS